MNTLETHSIINPFNQTDECAKFLIDDVTYPFALSDIATIGQEYTLTFWIKSEETGSISVYGKTIETTAEWFKHSDTFTAIGTDVHFQFNTNGTYYIYHPQLEFGNKSTDWSPAPEDMASMQELETVKSSIISTQTSISDLAVTTENISASVTRIEKDTLTSLEGITSDLASLTEEVAMKISPEDVSITVRQEMANGTSKVVTNTGYTFDDEGMTVAKSGSEMKTQITDNGMTVYQNEEAVLTANNVGVDAKNLHATTYLIVGTNSRFEDYGGRTGCFWIGE